MRRAFLEGSHVYLRQLDAADATEDYVSWLNDPEVTRFLETGKFPSTLDSVRAYMRRFEGSTTDLLFGIIDRKTGRHIGNVTLNHINWVHRTADTGLMIGRREFWGKGYAHEAWALVIDYAFSRLGLRKLIAGLVDGNHASQTILERLGFQLEGRFRAEYWVNGASCDALRLGLLREEFVPEGTKPARKKR